MTDHGKEILLFKFPTLTAPTVDLQLKKSGVSMARFIVRAEYSGVCRYEIYVRAIEGAGESNVKIVGAAELQTSAVTVTETPGVLIPSTLTDRTGISILNYQGAGVLFVSEDISKLPEQAWPVPKGGGWSLDITAGVTLYAVSSSGDLDVRIAEAGG